MVVSVTNQISDLLSSQLGLVPDAQAKILKSLITLIFVWAIHVLLSKLLNYRIKNYRFKYTFSKVMTYLSSITALILVGRVWLVGFESLTTYLGLVSAGLTIALKDLVNDFAGWLFIVTKQPFKLGDRIQIGEHKGDVIDIDALQFTLMELAAGRIDAEQSTGRMIHIPNAQVFKNPLANYTKGFEYIWNEIPVVVTFESNRKKTKDILVKILDRHGKAVVEQAKKKIDEASERFLISAGKLNPRVYTDIRDHGVLFTLRYLCHPQQARDTIEKITEDILEHFDNEQDIDLAYPTSRVFRNNEEGKHLSKNT